MSLREEFDLDPELTYLNAGNQSFLPRQVAEAIRRYHDEYERNPTQGMERAWGRLWEVQKRLARFLYARPEDLFLRPNVTAVLNAFILGMPLPRGNEILVGELEYGAIFNVCRLRAQRDGLRLRTLKMPATPVAMARLTSERLLEEIISQLGPRTGMVLLSHVVSGTGLKLPLRELARETRSRGILLAVDGAYAPGAFRVSLDELEDVDFYGCSSYKWLMGPKGTAFGWVPARHQESLRPIHAGWSTFSRFSPFAAFGGGSRFQEAFLLAGCHDFAPFFAIDDTLALWARLTPERIYDELRELQRALERGMENVGWKRLRASDDELNGPLLAFLVPAHLQTDGGRLGDRLLREAHVQGNLMSLRGRWYLVLSPHVYNTRAEIAAAVAQIASLV